MIACCSLVLPIAQSAHARIFPAGSYDLDFDADGIVTTILGDGNRAEGMSVAIQPDGKIVVAATVEDNSKFRFGAVRYNANGSIDSSFGNNGAILIPVGRGDAGVYSVILQSDGKIVLAGYADRAVTNTDFAVVRLTSTGQLDPTFDGDGIAIHDAGTNGEDSVYGAALQADGKIVLAGSTFSGTQGNVLVARLDTSGGLDPSFDSDGIATTDFFTFSDGATSVAITSDQKIVVAGYAISPSGTDAFISRYNTNGQLDSSFDTDGKVTINMSAGEENDATSLAIQSDGKVVITGYTYDAASNNNNIFTARVNTDGSLDSSFGSDGRISIDNGQVVDVGRTIRVQPNGRIVIVGITGSDINEADFIVVRLLANGLLDDSFGTGGKQIFAPTQRSMSAVGMALQDDGKIVSVGYGNVDGRLDLLVTRIHGEVLDTTPLVPAPQSTSYKTGNKKVTVRWSAVAGAASYVVTNSAGATQCTSTTTSCDVAGLRNGKLYTFSVYALNTSNVQSTSGTEVRVIPGFTLKKTSFTVKKSVKLSSIITTPSKGTKTWRVTSGSCRLSGSKLVMPKKAGSCKVKLTVAKNKSYPKMSTTVRVVATR